MSIISLQFLPFIFILYDLPYDQMKYSSHGQYEIPPFAGRVLTGCIISFKIDDLISS